MKRWGLLFCLACIGRSGQLLGATITLEITAETMVFENAAETKMSIVNLGDEPAIALQTILEISGHRFVTQMLDTLSPGATEEQAVRFSLAGVKPGIHQAIIFVFYTDLNGHPFTALAHTRVPIGDAGVPFVVVTMDDLDLGEGLLPVTVANLKEAPVAASLRLVLPRELGTDDDTREVKLEGRGRTEARFQIVNHSALAQSRYPVFALVDYEFEGAVVSAIAEAHINVVETPIRDVNAGRSAARRRLRPWLLWAVGSIMVLLLGRALWAARKPTG